MKNPAKNIFNIPASLPFAKTLAQTLLKQTQAQKEQLSRILILLPTRRACRVLQDSFIELHDNKPLLLPRMQPIGDLDEEELSLSIMAQGTSTEIISLPPAMSSFKRQILLARLVQKFHPDHTHEQALKLAHTLGRLMDQIYTENLHLSDLKTLVPEEFAEHWQITLKFLEIISEYWPQILKEQGMIDPADRRNRLILSLAEFWQNHPPAHPVIAAGSTGSIPATAKLLSVIASFDQGQIILPGFDENIDDESWADLNETHPQYGFKQLFTNIDINRKGVRTLDNIEKTDRQIEKDLLAREIMRPPETTQNWVNIRKDKDKIEKLKTSLDNVSILTCQHNRQEAEAISILMRQVLETPDKTACLITPDRSLAAHVSQSCKRWNINIDDSAGEPLSKTQHGVLLQLCVEAILSNFAPLSLLALLKHKFCVLNQPTKIYRNNLENLDYILRGLKPQSGLNGLIHHIEKQDKIDPALQKETIDFLNILQPIFEPLLKLNKGKNHFTTCLKTHLEICETLAETQNHSGAQALWKGENGHHASLFLTGLFDHTQDLVIEGLEDYIGILNHFMEQTQIRPNFGTHPRLQLLGQLEARLINADLVILGGLNEGTWPSEASPDPWLSRPMKKNFGLPSPERAIGLAAHDFVQGLCAENVILTRSIKSQGAPTVPSRWLQRIDAVLEAANINKPQNKTILHWAKNLDHAENIKPATRPAPCPDIAQRPRKLSVTAIETWLRDPYAIYARYILKLKKLEPFEKEFDAAQHGTLLHAIFERFIKETKTALPKTPESSIEHILSIAREELKEHQQNDYIWSFWWPRFSRIAHWFAHHDLQHRENTQNLTTENNAVLRLSEHDFEIRGIADRIDKDNNGHHIIIDYKSGGTFSKTAMQSGELPQLPLEGLMLEKGGFQNIPAGNTSALQYWVLNGSGNSKIINLDKDIKQLIMQAHENLQHLISAYNEKSMPYISLPRADKAPRFNDYEHLCRVREWGVSDDDNNNNETEAA